LPPKDGAWPLQKDFRLFLGFFVGVKTVRSNFLLAKMPAGGCKNERVFLSIFNKDSKLMSCYRIALKTQDLDARMLSRTLLRISRKWYRGRRRGVQPLVGKGNDHERQGAE
jgi:hypothetical protein